MTNSRPAPSGEDKNPPEDPAPMFGPVRRAYPIETRIDAEQVKLLLSLGEASRFTIFGAIAVVGAAFYETAPLWTIAVVAAIQLVAQFLFDRVRTGFHADPDAEIGRAHV